MRSPRGVTLLEIMIVVAIIGIVASLSVSTLSGVGGRNATQNATNEILSVLQSSRSISDQNASDVYVILYPKATLTWNATHTKVTGGTNSTGGAGAIVVYEDADGDFLTAGSGTCSGSDECSWSNFPGSTALGVGPQGIDRIVKIIDLADYPKKNVKFGGSGTGWTAPFTAAATTSCSFCGTSPAKGGILFTDGQAVLLNDTGTSVSATVGGFALQAVDNSTNETRIAVVRATGLITSVK